MLTPQTEVTNSSDNNILTVDAATRARALERKLSTSVQLPIVPTEVQSRLLPTTAGETSEEFCENGVCAVSWKPRRPAA